MLLCDSLSIVLLMKIVCIGLVVICVVGVVYCDEGDGVVGD